VRLMRVVLLLQPKSKLKSFGLSSVLVFAFLLAATANAAPIETAYTLDGQVGPIVYTGGSVTLDPVVSGGGDPLLSALNLDIDCLDGVCDILTQDWILFEVTVVSGNVGEVGLTLFDTFASGLEAEGMGYLLGGGPVQDGAGGTDIYTGSVIGDPDLPIFNFEANGGGAGLGVGTTTLVLFVAYGDGLLPQTPTDFGVFGDGAVSFMVEPFGGAGAGSAQGNFTTSIGVIPEPTTGLLMGIGLVMLGVHSRFRRS